MTKYKQNTKYSMNHNKTIETMALYEKKVLIHIT